MKPILTECLPNCVQETFPENSTLPRYVLHYYTLLFLTVKITFYSSSTAQVSVLGQTFHPGVIVCLKSPTDSELPEFGEVIHILVPEESKLLVVRRVYSNYYSGHYNAYAVHKSSDTAMVNVCDLALHDVFHLYKLSSMYYVVVRSCNHVEICI